MSNVDWATVLIAVLGSMGVVVVVEWAFKRGVVAISFVQEYGRAIMRIENCGGRVVKDVRYLVERPDGFDEAKYLGVGLDLFDKEVRIPVLAPGAVIDVNFGHLYQMGEREDRDRMPPVTVKYSWKGRFGGGLRSSGGGGLRRSAKTVELDSGVFRGWYEVQRPVEKVAAEVKKVTEVLKGIKSGNDSLLRILDSRMVTEKSYRFSIGSEPENLMDVSNFVFHIVLDTKMNIDDNLLGLGKVVKTSPNINGVDFAVLFSEGINSLLFGAEYLYWRVEWLDWRGDVLRSEEGEGRVVQNISRLRNGFGVFLVRVEAFARETGKDPEPE